MRLAGRVPCTYEHVRRIFKEYHVPHDNIIVALANALGADVEELRYLAAVQKTPNVVRDKMRELEVSYATSGTKEGGAGASGLITIPIVGAASAKLNGESQVEWEHDQFLGAIAVKGNLRALRVQGDSLAPIALDGQMVVYDMDRRPKKGDLCVAVVTKGKSKGETLIKRYFEEGDFAVLTPNSYTGSPVMVKKGEADFYLVIGVWFAS